jgi:6-pyruvoyltetrahydropterin/6-carboxytetrahydropterin synthase
LSLIRISKEFRWEMGHRLPYHEGGCANVHGHSYRLVVELCAELDEQGMVMDYGDVSAAVKPILAELDHAYMIDPSDQEVRATLSGLGLKMVEVPFFSTAENIAAWLLERLKPSLAGPRIQELVVRVHETASTMAEARWTR